MAKTELCILQKDGTLKKLTKAEFDKYLNDRIVHTEDVKNLTNASGKFVDLADVVEVCIDDMFEDEFNRFLALTTIRKNGEAKLVFDVAVDDMYQLAGKVFEFAPNADEWVKKWHENNEDKDMAYMFADALEDNIFENASSLEFLLMFLTIFVYNGSVEENKRIKISDWY